jgi:Putative restriction endonuclease
MALPALHEPEFEGTCPADDAEPQGCIFRVIELDDGSVEEVELPLTMERLLHPREGDKVTQSDFHLSFLVSMLDRLRRWLETAPGVGVFSDLRFEWNRPGLKPSGPDIAVVKGLPEPRKAISERIGGTFDTAVWGVRPVLVIEVVSPEHGRLRRKDLEDNVDIYARAGVEEYLIFNPIRLGSQEPLELLGYRLTGGPRYQRISPDRQGRILSRSTELYFWSDPAGRRVEIFDESTGVRLLSADEEKARADAARAEIEAKDAEIARLRALLERRD